MVRYILTERHYIIAICICITWLIGNIRKMTINMHIFVSMWLFFLMSILLAPCNSKRLPSKGFYPIQFSRVLTHIKDADNVRGTLSTDSLTCFKSNSTSDMSILSIVTCLVPPLFILSSNEQCYGLWGSNSMVVQNDGYIELLKVSNDIEESAFNGDHATLLDFDKWVDLEPSAIKKILQIPSEPFVVCARSVDLFGRNSSFDISFREAYLRDKDQLVSQEEILFHFATLIISSSSWCFPYFAALSVGSFVYVNGIHITISLLCLSGCVVCLAPIMFTAKNRRMIFIYLSYFFGPTKHEETRFITKERKPLFHALFLSSVLMIFGSTLCYVFYHYFGINREVRNTLLKIVITASISWFTFFVGRSFDVFASHVSWIPLASNITRKLSYFTNPKCSVKLMVVVGISSFLVSEWARRYVHSSIFVEKIISGFIISRASIYNLILKKITRSSSENTGTTQN